MQRLLRIFKKDVRAGSGLIEVKKAQIERRDPSLHHKRVRGRAVAGGQRVAAVARSERKTATRATRQRPREPIDDGAEQRTQIGLRAQAATELDQRLAVVVALAVEDAVDALLNGALERVEELRGNDDRGDQSPGAEARQPFVNQLAGDGDQQEVEARRGSRSPGYR